MPHRDYPVSRGAKAVIFRRHVEETPPVKATLKGWSKGLALVAAWLFLIQSLAGGFALAAGEVPLDAFGNPLCITSGDHKGVPSGDHGKMPGCCMLGCAASATMAGTPPDEASLVIAFQIEAAGQPLPAPIAMVQADDHDSGSPRAPPTIA